MKKWILVLLSVMMIWCCWGAMAEYSPGYLMQPPREVLEHIERSFSSYTLEDYCEVEDTPEGDYGFAMLTAGDERLLVGYKEKDGKMSYWLKNHGAVPRGSEEAWFSVSEKGKEYIVPRTDQTEVSDGLSFSVTQLDDVGESYENGVSYHWEDGGFKLTSYHRHTPIGVYIEDGYLEFWDWSWWRKDGTVKGAVQTDIRYVNFNTLPATLEEAKESVTTAPQMIVGNFHPQVIRFTGGGKYAVYTGPGEQYARSGNGKGQVSTNDWIEVYGRCGEWIMIQYDISAEQYRIGWIEADALPQGADVPELSFEKLDQRLIRDCILTDDPLNSEKKLLSLKADTPVVSLADFGEHFYIEVTVDGKTYWGFVDADCVTKG